MRSALRVILRRAKDGGRALRVILRKPERSDRRPKGSLSLEAVHWCERLLWRVGDQRFGYETLNARVAMDSDPTLASG